MNLQSTSPFGVKADARLEPDRVVSQERVQYDGKRCVRVYWNIGNAAPYFWSFDFGDSSSEKYVRGFVSEVPMRTRQTGRKEAWPNPSGWLEGEGYVLLQEGYLHLLKCMPVALHIFGHDEKSLDNIAA